MAEKKLTETEKENLKAFTKLADLQEFQEKGIQGDIVYSLWWEDPYGYVYRIYKERQKDGNFHGKITKRNISKKDYKVVYSRRQKKTLKALFEKKYWKNVERKNRADKKRSIAKKERESLKPVLTKSQKRIQKVQVNIQRLQANIKRNTTKLRRCTTRITNDQKDIKRYEKELQRIDLSDQIGYEVQVDKES
tara:strand:- start:1368 stop:1943 length:576 start_codon:yes stop_codon:yes gene_type:complete